MGGLFNTHGRDDILIQNFSKTLEGEKPLERPSFTLIYKQLKSSSVYFNLYVFRLKMGRQKILKSIVASIP
jgi:hypothetical protein